MSFNTKIFFYHNLQKKIPRLFEAARC